MKININKQNNGQSSNIYSICTYQTKEVSLEKQYLLDVSHVNDENGEWGKNIVNS